MHLRIDAGVSPISLAASAWLMSSWSSSSRSVSADGDVCGSSFIGFIVFNLHSLRRKNMTSNDAMIAAVQTAMTTTARSVSTVMLLMLFAPSRHSRLAQSVL